MDYGTIDSKGSGAETSRPSTLPRPQRIFEAKKSVTLHIHLKAILQGITIGASLLPSLRAQHKVRKCIKYLSILIFFFHINGCEILFFAKPYRQKSYSVKIFDDIFS
jgi:hypothetical protein